MEFKKQDLIYALSNNQKRRSFAENYRDWGLWKVDEDLGLKIYKLDLAEKFRIVVIEYWQENYSYKVFNEKNKYYACHNVYIQKSPYFNPNQKVSENQLANELMLLRDRLRNERNK